MILDLLRQTVGQASESAHRHAHGKFGVEMVVGPSDPENAVRDNKVDLVLVIDKKFASNFSESRPAPVQVFSDSTRQSVQPKLKRLTTLLSDFSAQTGTMRLIARGVTRLWPVP